MDVNPTGENQINIYTWRSDTDQILVLVPVLFQDVVLVLSVSQAVASVPVLTVMWFQTWFRFRI